MSLLTLKLKTLGMGAALAILSWVIVEILFWIPSIHGLYKTLESFIYNQIFTSTASPSEHLIIIDEQQKEYDRAAYGRLISGLDRLGAKIIVLDVLFNAEKDSAQNAALLTATRAASNKVIHAIEFLDRNNQAVVPDKFQLKIPNKPTSDNYIEGVRGALMPFDDLLQATEHLGHITQTSNLICGGEQSFPLIIPYNDRLYPSLPLLAVMKFWGCRTDTLPKEPYETIESIKNETNDMAHAIPIEYRAQILINFISQADERFSGKIFSLEKAFTHIEKNENIFRNKIVLIGNSLDSQEQTDGPHFQTYPNLIVYAALISQLLNGENIKEGFWESILLNFILVVWGIVGLAFRPQKLERVRPWQFYLLSFLLLLLTAALALRLRVKIHVLVPYAVFCLSSFLSRLYYDKRLKESIGTKKKTNYLDYYLLIGPRREEGKTYPVFLIDSPAGEDFCELKFLLQDETIKKIREEMAQNFKLEIKTLKEIGAALFEALLQPAIRGQYDKSLGMAYAQNAYLRIKLRIDAPDLAGYPWEYMFDGKRTKEFLALHKRISVTRFLAIREPVPNVSLKPPLKILVIIPSPIDKLYADLGVEKEKNLLNEALQKLERMGIVQLRFLDQATLKGLARELRRKVDVIHFIGHGAYSESLGGCLVFENELGESELINIDRLGKLLEGNPIRLVVLNACQTAQTSDSDISMGVAQGLVRIGVPAVIAMQFRILDESAIDFTREFYTTLADTFQVDRAVSEARQNMFINLESGRIDWGIPVLFMRKDDGILFH